MAVIRCPRGHYYDAQRFSRCPHCGVSASGADVPQKAEDAPKPADEKKRGLFGWLDREKTVALSPEKAAACRPGGEGEDALTQKHVAPEEAQGLERDDQRTVGFFSGARGNDYVTGWLVCVEGFEKGRDYRLHHGFNRIGRSVSMDVQVLDDPAVTRDNHCCVVYDDKKNRFSVIPSSGALTYYNGRLLTGPEQLKAGDELNLGNSRFEFIPFCREGRIWEKEDGEQGSPC